MSSRYSNPVPQYLNSSAEPYSGGLLYFYEPGTVTPKDTYSDAALSSANDNPVVLTSGGSTPNIFLDGTYRVIFKDADGVQVWDRDNVNLESATNFSTWASSITYSQYDIVLGSDGGFYVSKTNNNSGNNPTTDTTNWETFREKIGVGENDSPTFTGLSIKDTTGDHNYTLGVSELTANRTITLPLLTGNDTFAFVGFAQTWTALQTFSQGATVAGTFKLADTTGDHFYQWGVSELAANRTVTMPLLTGNDTFVFEAHTQTLTNKTLTAPAMTGLATGEQLELTEDLQARNFSGKNKIIGGDFSTNPWQRGTSFTNPATGSYSADRWRWIMTSDAVVDLLKTADAPTLSINPHASQHCLHVDVTTADATIAAGQFAAIEQRIEGHDVAGFGFGKSGAGYVTIQFDVKSPKTGTHCLTLQNNAGNRSYVAEYTVDAADTWEHKEVTVPVDTSGTWEYTTSAGLKVLFILAAGSTYQTTAGAWAAGNYLGSASQVNCLDSASNNFKIANVQLEAGEKATEFEALPVGQVYALCRRYRRQSYSLGTAPATATTTGSLSRIAMTTAALQGIEFDEAMRAAPTVTIYGTDGASAKVNAFAAGTSVGTSVTASNIGDKGFLAANDSGSGFTAGSGYRFHYVADAEL